MSNDENFINQLREEFFETTSSELDGWEEIMLKYEKQPSTQLVAQLKQKIHSLKGSAQAIDFNVCATILHDLETWIINTMPAMSSKEATTKLLQMIDLLRNYVQKLETGSKGEAEIQKIQIILK